MSALQDVTFDSPGSMPGARLAKSLPAINGFQTIGSLGQQHPPWILGGKSADLIQLPKLVLGGLGSHIMWSLTAGYYYRPDAFLGDVGPAIGNTVGPVVAGVIGNYLTVQVSFIVTIPVLFLSWLLFLPKKEACPMTIKESYIPEPAD